MFGEAGTYTREELLFGRALSKQKVAGQRKILAQAINKRDSFLVEIENKTYQILIDRLKEYEKHIKLHLPGARVA